MKSTELSSQKNLLNPAPPNGKQTATFVDDQPSKVVPAKLSRSEINGAAKRLEMTAFDAKKFKSMHTMGRFLSEEGAVEVAVGKFMMNDTVRDRAITMIQKRLREMEDCLEPGELADLSRALNQLLTASDNNMRATLHAARQGLLKQNESGPRNPLPPKGTQILAQNVTVVQGEGVSPKRDAL